MTHIEAASNGQAGLEATLPTPAAFDFPYPQPYAIQLELMQTVFRAIEDRKIAIVESPTGTGKSLTLLTSTLTWLAAHQKRTDEAVEAALRERLTLEDPDDPPWAIEHAVKAQLADLRAAGEARRERLAQARARERKLRVQGRSGAFRGAGGPGPAKKARVDAAGDDGVRGGSTGDDEFLPEDKEADQMGGDAGEDAYLSAEVRGLMQKYESARPKRGGEPEEAEEDVTKIYYTSRTHSQLRQLTSELLKTNFPHKIIDGAPPTTAANSVEAEEEGVSLVPLGSRRQLCINEKVRALAKTSGDERLNEACLDMQKACKARCDFLPSKDEEGKMLDARDGILASVQDIEDIVVAGKASGVCPYYATRKAVKPAQIVTLPYNLLLQKNAREALGISLKDQIVVIDEAHNLIDTLLSIYSTSLTSSQLSNATSQLQQYLARFKNRLKATHALWIRQTLSVLQGLVRVCEGSLEAAAKDKGRFKPEMMDTNTLMNRVGGGTDQVNLVELVAYLRESKLARKVSGFTERTAEESQKKGEWAPNGTRGGPSQGARHAAISAFHQVEAFLLSMTDARTDGRIILSVEPAASSEPSAKPVAVLRYILLNPAERFKEVVSEARSVVLAGGTMEPISDFMIQLFPDVPRDRISTLSCAHVIPKTNLLTQVVSLGPRKREFELKFANRDDEGLLNELGAVIQSVVGLVPDGVVVFLPSYAFLDKVKKLWTQSGLLAKLDDKKQLFYEPQISAGVEAVLRDYALAIETARLGSKSVDSSAPKRIRTGALLFAVVGGKLSEGINFSDHLGRCVIMVGLPFANVGSVELQERMRYVEKLPGAGKDAANQLYENLCMRAVNQSIGRAIRHANDYACILLVDRRYSTPRIRNKLPKWIGDDVQVPSDYSGVARAVAAFFRDKRERGLR